MVSRSILISLLIVLVLVVPPEMTSAAGESGTNTLERGEYQIFPYGYTSYFDLKVSYYVEVTLGPKIDVFVTNEDGYQQFLSSNPEFIHYPDASSLNVYMAEKEATFPENDKYYIIIDNSDRGTDPPSEGAQVTYRYTIEFNEFSVPTDLCIVGALILFVVFMVLAVRWMYKPIKEPLVPTPPQQEMPQEHPEYPREKR